MGAMGSRPFLESYMTHSELIGHLGPIDIGTKLAAPGPLWDAAYSLVVWPTIVLFS